MDENLAERCELCGDAMAIETEEGWKCIGCGHEQDDPVDDI